MSTSSEEKKTKSSNLDTPAAIASSASGVTLLLNYSLPKAFSLAPADTADLLIITPVLGGVIAWGIARLFKAYGRDPQLINNERAIRKKIKLIKQDLKDPNILEAERADLQKEYTQLRKLLRHPELLSSSIPLEGK